MFTQTAPSVGWLTLDYVGDLVFLADIYIRATKFGFVSKADGAFIVTPKSIWRNYRRVYFAKYFLSLFS